MNNSIVIKFRELKRYWKIHIGGLQYTRMNLFGSQDCENEIKCDLNTKLRTCKCKLGLCIKVIPSASAYIIK